MGADDADKLVDPAGNLSAAFGLALVSPPADRLLADLDMPVLLYRFQDMTVFGAERSTLGPIVRRAVRSAGVDLTPDQNPDQAFFVRSDHYRFVEKGIPSVFLWPGQKGDGGKFAAGGKGKMFGKGSARPAKAGRTAKDSN